MSIVAKALWYIENNYAEAGLTLDGIALACDVSRFHLTRAFGIATGRSLMRYLRARRMTEAARVLAAGAPDILAVALDAGYGSHEAFTRAFRDQFGLTPEAVRARGSCAGIDLVPALRLDDRRELPPAAPVLIAHPAFTVAGLCERYTHESAAAIPAQWQRLGACPAPPDKIGRFEYGVCSEAEGDAFTYTCGVAVTGLTPAGAVLLRVPAQRYAVFFHAAHISAIRMTWRAIFDDWLPASGMRPTDGPEFERYDERFDPATGDGGVEIWVPVASPSTDTH
jgi:AraC family transcriptional regulator